MDAGTGRTSLVELQTGVFEFFFGLRGSLPKSGPLDFATKNTFPLFFVSEEALVSIY